MFTSQNDRKISKSATSRLTRISATAIELRKKIISFLHISPKSGLFQAFINFLKLYIFCFTESSQFFNYMWCLVVIISSDRILFLDKFDVRITIHDRLLNQHHSNYLRNRVRSIENQDYHHRDLNSDLLGFNNKNSRKFASTTTVVRLRKSRNRSSSMTEYHQNHLLIHVKLTLFNSQSLFIFSENLLISPCRRLGGCDVGSAASPQHLGRGVTRVLIG